MNKLVYRARPGDEEGKTKLRHLISERAWANKILAAPDCTFPNGKSSHDCAAKILERIEDDLLEFACLQVEA